MVDQKYKLCPVQTELISSKLQEITIEVDRIKEYIGPSLSKQVGIFLAKAPTHYNCLNKAMTLYIEFYNTQMQNSIANKVLSYIPGNTYSSLDDNAKCLADYTSLQWKSFSEIFNGSGLLSYENKFSKNSEVMSDVIKKIYAEFFKAMVLSNQKFERDSSNSGNLQEDFSSFVKLVKESSSFFDYPSMNKFYAKLQSQCSFISSVNLMDKTIQEKRSFYNSEEYKNFKIDTKLCIKEIETEIISSVEKVSESYVQMNLMFEEISFLLDENLFSKFPKSLEYNVENCEFKKILDANLEKVF